MTLVKYRGNNLFPAFREMENLFDQFFSRPEEGFLPALNIASDKDGFFISAELPGMNSGDVEISVEKGILTLSGEKKDVNEEEGRIFHRKESVYGKFSHKIRLPEEADSEQISASFESGVLKISIKKKEAVKPKTIPIHAG